LYISLDERQELFNVDLLEEASISHGFLWLLQYFPFQITYPNQLKQINEHVTVTDSLQTDYFQAIIADHVHVIQNIEAYKGKLIVYSMGKFYF